MVHLDAEQEHLARGRQNRWTYLKRLRYNPTRSLAQASHRRLSQVVEQCPPLPWSHDRSTPRTPVALMILSLSSKVSIASMDGLVGLPLIACKPELFSSALYGQAECSLIGRSVRFGIGM